jgi:hypothetical protein
MPSAASASAKSAKIVRKSVAARRDAVERVKASPTVWMA